MMKWCVFFFALWSTTLGARLEDHLKKISDKGTGHAICNVDFIYLINLDERPEKFESCIRQLTPYGIAPYRFSAVNGWKLSLEVINDLGVKYAPGMKSDLLATCYPIEMGGKPLHEIMHVPGRTYFHHGVRQGTIGIVLSHLSVLKDALEAGYKTIWVMEDDIEVVRNPRFISKKIRELDRLVGRNGWDLLFTDQDTIDNATGNYLPCDIYAPRPNFSPKHPERFAQKTEVGKGFRKVGARYGMYSVIIRRSGMKKIFRFIKKYRVFHPIDMDFILPSDIRLFTVTDDIVSTQRNALTDNNVPGFAGKKQRPGKGGPVLAG